MARKDLKVWLGFEDEYITEKNKHHVNFTTNKIGGFPDYPQDITLECPKCPLCQLKQLFISQIYAPIEDSTYHRTLYVFACINPNCWSHKESWTCLRIQTLEKVVDQNTTDQMPNATVTDWCKDADDWDDDDFNANMTEENGNLISSGKISDEDDESCSFDDSLRQCMGNLMVDDQNANMGAHGGAVGKQHSPSASAEIEGDEGEMITIDTPTYPQRDLNALLQEVVPLPQDVKQSSLYFLPCFLSVYEEVLEKSIVIDTHVRELIQEYQLNSDDLSIGNDDNSSDNCSSGEVLEKYEKSTPAHGDKMFHNFLSKIQINPGQILRYCRDDSALLTPTPLQDYPKKCQHCQGDITYECQLLPTIISKLRLINDAHNEPRLDFANVIIFTCKKSCWTSDTVYKNEHVVVQYETY